MARPYEFFAIERVGEAICARLQRPRIEDHQMEDFGAELARLVDEENCRKLVLHLGPGELECLKSMLLAKLIKLQRRLDTLGGALALTEVGEETRGIFKVAGIEKYFHFYPDRACSNRSNIAQSSP